MEVVSPDVTRRGFLKGVGGVMAAGAIASTPVPASASAVPPPIRRVAVSDRAIGLRQNLGVFAIASAAGLHGVELDMGRLGNRPRLLNRLAESAERQPFLDQVAITGVPIASLALTAFAEQSFARHPQAGIIADAWLDALRDCGVRNGVLPFGPACDLTHAVDRALTIERLKPAAARAEREQYTIALHTAVPADVLAGVLDAVGSPAVAACVTAGPNAVADVQTIGLRRVVQIRYRPDAHAGLDELTRTLAAGEWNGWVVLDRVRADAEGPVMQCVATTRAIATLVGRATVV